MLPTLDIREYARRGAQSRLAELHEEQQAIIRAFPELRQGTRKRGRPAASNVVINHEEQVTRSRPGRKAAASSAQPSSAAAPETRARKARPRRTMTAAQRKAVGERMRRYWAARKKAASA